MMGMSGMGGGSGKGGGTAILIGVGKVKPKGADKAKSGNGLKFAKAAMHAVKKDDPEAFHSAMRAMMMDCMAEAASDEDED